MLFKQNWLQNHTVIQLKKFDSFEQRWKFGTPYLLFFLWNDLIRVDWIFCRVTEPLPIRDHGDLKEQIAFFAPLLSIKNMNK